MDDLKIKEAMNHNKSLIWIRKFYKCLAGIPLVTGCVLSIFGSTKEIGEGLLYIGVFIAVLCLVLYPIGCYGIKRQFMQGKIDMYGNRIGGKQSSVKQLDMNQQRTPPRQTASQRSGSRNEPSRQQASDSGGDAKGLWEDPLVRMATYYATGKVVKKTAKAMGFQLPPSHKPMKLDPFHSTHMDGFSGESTSGKVSNYYEIKTMSNGNEYLIDTARNTNVAYYDRMKDATFQDLKRIGKGNLLLTLVK